MNRILAALMIVIPGQPVQADFPDAWSYIDKNQQRRSTLAVHGQSAEALASTSAIPLPQANSIVYGTIVKISSKEAVLHIHTVDGHVSKSALAQTSVYPEDGLAALIRLENIRKTEKDKLKMGECFRVGDTVKAQVLSLGDARYYECSTAENNLGVVAGLSRLGNKLVPVSWQHMSDQITGELEQRKVAKPEDSE